MEYGIPICTVVFLCVNLELVSPQLDQKLVHCLQLCIRGIRVHRIRNLTLTVHYVHIYVRFSYQPSHFCHLRAREVTTRVLRILNPADEATTNTKNELEYNLYHTRLTPINCYPLV